MVLPKGLNLRFVLIFERIELVYKQKRVPRWKEKIIMLLSLAVFNETTLIHHQVNRLDIIFLVFLNSRKDLGSFYGASSSVSSSKTVVGNYSECVFRQNRCRLI